MGEPGDDDDAGSLAKRAANVGRAVIYLSFVVVGVRLLTKDAPSSGGAVGGSGGDKASESTTRCSTGRVVRGSWSPPA